MEDYFSKINHYQTLNILIPYEEIKETFGEIEFDPSLFSPNGESEYPASREAFLYKAALEKKFFLVEKETDRKYFKLPLVKFSSNEELPILINNIQGILDRPNIQNNVANSPEFQTLINSLDYKNLLSFVAILVKESLEKTYPDLDNILNRTLSIIRNNSTNLELVGNRNSRDIWSSDTDSFEEELNTPTGTEVNLGYEFLKGIIKSVANMSDPTWKTEWFLPGPLTPVGVVAKLLEGWKGDETAEKAAEENKPKFEVIQTKTDPEECKD